MANDVYILKSCPFCGGAPSIRRNDTKENGIWWWVQCATCGAETKATATTEEMAIIWNARHDQAVEEMKGKKVCATCKWRSDDFTSVCVNDSSDHLADFVTGNETCGMWEKK